MFWWKKTGVSSSFEIRRNWKKTIFKRSATIAVAAVLLLPVPLLTKIELFKTAFAAGQPTVSSVTPNNGSSAGGTSVSISGTNFEAITGLTQISSNSNNNCAISADKQAYCWGYNSDGQLGDGTQTRRSTPTPVDTSGVLNGKKISQISTDTHTCVLTTDNGIYCWGDNAQGQLGSAMAYNTRSLVPVAVDTSGVLSGKTITQVVVSGNNTCALDSTGKVYCWGWNFYGQLGDNTTTRSNVPVAVNTSGVLSGKVVSQIAPSLNSTCVLATDGKAYCWGLGGSGQLGNNSTGNSGVPVAVTSTGVLSGKTINAIATGNGHTCVTTTSNNIYCWGINTNGMIGDNSTTNRLVPTAVVVSGVLSGKTLGKMGLGQDISCVTDSTGKAYCWGRNSNGNLGNNSTTQSNVPVAVVANGALNGKSISEIDAGNFHTCARTTDNAAYCWGDNAYDQLGDNTATDSSVPVTVINLPVSQPTVTFGGTAAANTTVVNSTTITATTPAHSTGNVDVAVISLNDQQGTLANGYTYSAPGPTISTLSPDNGPSTGFTSVTVTGTNFVKGSAIMDVSSGGYHSCAVTNNGPYCWGANDVGQLGDSSASASTIPVAVDTSGVLSGKTISKIVTGNKNSCALDIDGAVYCWGDNQYGQLGNNSATPSAVPVAVDTSGVLSGKDVTDIAAGFDNICAIASDQKAYCWGDNQYGQLGNNSATPSAVPVAVDTSGVLSGKDVTDISSGNGHTCAITTEYKIYCWGYNQYGQLGNGQNNTASAAPVAVDTSGVLNNKDVKIVSAGYSHTCIVASDNAAYCWGWNIYGQLGNNSNTDATTAVAVNASGALTGKNLTQISADGVHTCAIDSAGLSYCWGDNSSGQLGNGTTTPSIVPIAVSTGGELAGIRATKISVRLSHSCILADNGRAYCWGYNNSGQLGDSTNTNQPLPIPLYEADIIDDATTVSFDGQQATSIVVINDTTLRANTPAHTTGQVDVTVTNPDSQSGTLTDGYEYIFAATPPNPPTSLTATPASNSVDLTWTAPIDNGGSALTDYGIQYSDNGGSSWSTFSHTPSTATSISITGLTPGTTYSFRVIAVNAVGNSTPSNVVTGSPTYVSISTNGSVTISVLPSGGTRSSNSSHTVTLGTNNDTGYVLTLEMISASRNLVNGSETIAPVAGTFASPTSGLNTDSWGYRIDGVGGFGSGTASETNVLASSFTWAGVPAGGNSDTIRSSSEAITNDAFSVWYGMSADSAKPSGTYSNTVLYTAVAN